jgi:hypothetical protein
VFGLGEAVARAEHDQGDPAGVAAGGGQRRLGEAGVDPGVMFLLERRRQPSYVPPVDGRHMPPDGQRRPFVLEGGQVELHEATEAAGERRVASRPFAETETA